jgi:predicted metalloprotease with PDZ domain
MVFGQARKLAFILAAAQLLAAPSFGEPRAPAGATVVYSVTATELANHKIRVEAEFPAQTFDGEDRTLALPVWTPGSYKVRDYSKSITGMQLLDAGVARLEKTAKNRWTVVGDYPKDRPLRVAYTVYGHELTVRTNFFTPELSLLIGAATFVAPAPLTGERLDDMAFEVRLSGVTDPVSTALQPLPSNQAPTFLANGYDDLLDSPIVFGDISEHQFQAGGKPHVLVQAGDRRYWALATSLRDAAKVVQAVQDFWGQVPYDSYHIMNLITDTRGGLEHLDSTVIMTSRFATEDRDKYVEWLALLCHEHFHAWNVKRLRPKALGPFDYEKEVMTPSLWVAEGVTSYYDDLLVRRAGLSTRTEYLKALSGQLNTLMNTPGRKSLPLTEASLDAWIRLYQPTDNSINDDVSYYNKGAVVAFLLDTELRERSNGKITLDHVMREAYQAFAKNGFEEQEFRALAARVSGQNLDEFFRRAVDTTEELPIDDALLYWGLEWKPEDAKVAAEPFLGIATASADGRMVDSVAAGSPAATAGIAPGDELLAIDGTRVPASGPSSILKYLKVGGSYPVLVSRLGRIKECQVSLVAQPAPKRTLKFKTDKAASPARIDSWLGPESKVTDKSKPESFFGPDPKEKAN